MKKTVVGVFLGAAMAIMSLAGGLHHAEASTDEVPIECDSPGAAHLAALAIYENQLVQHQAELAAYIEDLASYGDTAYAQEYAAYVDAYAAYVEAYEQYILDYAEYIVATYGAFLGCGTTFF